MLFRLIFDAENSEFTGSYKILELYDELGHDYTFLIAYDRCYFSMTEIKEDIAKQLDITPAEIELEEV